MTPRTAHPVAPYVLLAELGTVLFGGTAASAEERITLEIIGAVRMVDPEAVSRADVAPVRTEASEAREATAGKSTGRMADRHN
ncbi:hypothetical protein [Methylobacterium sp. CM6246]